MEKILNITNGDCAVEVMKQANLPGAFLPWRDVLHEGPVPGGLNLEALSKVRAAFITRQGWGDPKAIQRSFVERDEVLKSHNDYKKVILWFEHDLYDQLQLIQILDWFNENASSGTVLSMICVDQYLGTLTPGEMLALVKYEQPVTESQLKLGSTAWAAFRADMPEFWAALLEKETTTLPFLEGAIVRMLEEYPSRGNGLSRSAQQALKIISEGETRPGRIFGRTFELEERRFMGDSSFWNILHELLASSPPLLILPEGKELTLPASPDQELRITAAGKAVLDGEKNWLEIHKIDRWIGGVHLTREHLWCWDSVKQQLYQPAL